MFDKIIEFLSLQEFPQSVQYVAVLIFSLAFLSFFLDLVRFLVYTIGGRR